MRLTFFSIFYPDISGATEHPWKNQTGMIGTFDAGNNSGARGGNRRPYYTHLGIVITVTG